MILQIAAELASEDYPDYLIPRFEKMLFQLIKILRIKKSEHRYNLII